MFVKSVSLREEIQNIDHIPAYMTDDQGHIIVWNQNAKNLLKYSEEEILGRSENLLYFHPIETKNIAGVRFSWRTDKDGNRLFLQETTVGIKEPNSNEQHYMKVLEDYTSHLTLPEECELWLEHHQRLNQAAIISTNTEPMRVAYLTDQMATFLGYEVSELQGQPVEKIIAPAIAAQALAVSEEITDDPEQAFKFNFYHKNGSNLVVLVNGAKVHDDKGRVFFLGHIRQLADVATESSDIFLAR